MASTSTITKTKDRTNSSTSSSRLKIGTQNKNVGWYTPNLTYLFPSVQSLFGNYSQIPSSELFSHILSIRDKAWAIHPFPFIGLLNFTSLSLSQTPSYNRILTTLTTTPGSIKLLDLGCGFGQDLRKLLYDGAPATSLYGVDVKPELIGLGYELFNDEATWGGKMIVGDLLEKDVGKNKIKKLEGKMDFVNISLFLHLFDYKTQLKACEKIVRLLKDQIGVTVVGTLIGNVEGREVESIGGRKSWRHDVESFEQLWGEVGRKCSTKWSVWAWLEEGEEKEWDEVGTRGLRFEVIRVG